MAADELDQSITQIKRPLSTTYVYAEQLNRGLNKSQRDSVIVASVDPCGGQRDKEIPSSGQPGRATGNCICPITQVNQEEVE